MASNNKRPKIKDKTPKVNQTKETAKVLTADLGVAEISTWSIDYYADTALPYTLRVMYGTYERSATSRFQFKTKAEAEAKLEELLNLTKPIEVVEKEVKKFNRRVEILTAVCLTLCFVALGVFGVFNEELEPIQHIFCNLCLGWHIGELMVMLLRKHQP